MNITKQRQIIAKTFSLMPQEAGYRVKYRTGPSVHKYESLELMHEIESCLSEELRESYLLELDQIVSGDDLWTIVRATGKQRQEALIRALGDWEELCC